MILKMFFLSIYGFYGFRPFWRLKLPKITLKEIPGVLVEVLDVVLEVLYLPWRSWTLYKARWFMNNFRKNKNFHHGGLPASYRQD